MAVRDDVLARRWLVGVQLTNSRLSTNIKQAEVATGLGVSAGLVSHFEQGKYSPERDQIIAMMAMYEEDSAAADRLASFAGRTGGGRSWLAPWEPVIAPFTRRYLGAEGFASRLFQYAPLVLPAMLQTPAYAAGMTAPSARVRADQEKALVDLRMKRQQRALDGDLHLTAVIEEDVLDRPAGDQEVMREQYAHLARMAELPNVDLLIIPTAVGRHDGLEGRFSVLHFETPSGEKEAGPVAYIEIPNDAVYKTLQDQVAAYTGSSELIVTAALSANDSIRAIRARLAA